MSLTIDQKREGATLTLSLVGRLDATTSPELDGVVKQGIDGVEKLVIDLTELEYISSAGLRVVLSAQKAMNKQGSMVVRNPSEAVRKVFDITGFLDFLTIE